MSNLPISIEEEMKKSYLDYAMSVIIGRALPESRDGLKPVQRRILYAMYREGLLPNKKYSKSAGVVGEVLKKYHPHGDSAVYDAMVRMAQGFNLRHPLVDGQGNFGSIDGDRAAAYRYTEARMSKIAEELLSDIDKDTVDFTPNFDETTLEPLVLPSKIPNLLINGASGIAVGMATNIPPHNLAEVIDALGMLLEKPASKIDDLMQHIKGPDFPTGGIICGRQGIVDAYKTARGSIKIRAKTLVELDHRGNERIIVTEVPYQVNKSNLIKKIAELVRAKKIEGISELRDESDRNGIRIVIELKRGELTQVVLNNLFKHTNLQTSFGVINLSLVDGRPQELNLKQVLWHFIQHRREVVTRRTRHELKRAQERAHILEGLKIALDNLDEIIALVRRSKTPDEAREGLIGGYSLSKTQAQAILDMKLQRLTGLEREKIINEYVEIMGEIKSLKEVLDKPKLLDGIIKTELLEIKEKYAEPRRTQITDEVTDISIEDMITEEEMVITISHTGYIKRNSLSTYKVQGRGGKGLKGMDTREEDYVEHLFIGSTHDYMLFFTNKGRLYWKKVYEIPEVGRWAKGKAMVNILPLGEDEKVATAIPVRDFERDFLVQITKKGIVKKSTLMDYSHPRANGIIAMTIRDDDELIAVRRTDGNKDLILGTAKGHAIRFAETDVRVMGRTATGVIGIRLKEGDELVSAVVAEERTSLLTVTENGMGKRTKIEGYPLQGRGGKGVISIKLTKKGGNAVGLIRVRDDDEVVMISSDGKIIRTLAGKISQLGRSTQGVRLMNLGKGERVTSLGRVADDTNQKQDTLFSEN